MPAGRPKKSIPEKQLIAFMQMKPTKEDTMAFFNVHEETFNRIMKEDYNTNFRDFRKTHMVHTRHALIRKAITMAKKGNEKMLIFCLKNLCGWSEKVESVEQGVKTFELAYAKPEPENKG